MNLLDASMQFPTVVFTIGLLIALVYWLFVILGALDIDLFGGVDDAAGAMKGAGDAVTGGIKGAAEAATGAAKGGAEALKVSPDADLWDWIGLGTLPVTVSASAVLMLGWSGSILAMHYGDTGSLGLALKLLVAAGILLVALPLAGLLLRPLRPVFEVKVGKSNRDYVGATCTITTGHVDADFGQATIEDAGGTVLIIAVRCDRPGELGRGAKALIIDFDPVRHAYVVEPQADLLPAPADGADRSA